jgi:hypothetical protein
MLSTVQVNEAKTNLTTILNTMSENDVTEIIDGKSKEVKGYIVKRIDTKNNAKSKLNDMLAIGKKAEKLNLSIGDGTVDELKRGMLEEYGY